MTSACHAFTISWDLIPLHAASNDDVSIAEPACSVGPNKFLGCWKMRRLAIQVDRLSEGRSSRQSGGAGFSCWQLPHIPHRQRRPRFISPEAGYMQTIIFSNNPVPVLQNPGYHLSSRATQNFFSLARTTRWRASHRHSTKLQYVVLAEHVLKTRTRTCSIKEDIKII